MKETDNSIADAPVLSREAADAAALRRLLAPCVDALGYELVHLELAGRARRYTLRLYIDAPGGIGVDDCEAVSRQVSAVLDVEDALPAAYVLEVSSPGLDRPLVTPAHFRRFAGRLARIVLHAPRDDGRRRFAGRLVHADDDGVLLEADGEQVELAYRAMASARLQPVF